MRKEDTEIQIDGSIPGHLWEIAREGARKMLQRALEHEVDIFIEANREVRLEDGRQRITRYGHNGERSIQTGLEDRDPSI